MTPSFAERKTVGLKQKLAALAADFDEWQKATAPGQSLEKHYTQVTAITAHLEGLRTSTEGLLADAIRDGTVLDDGRNIESLILGIRRIWEFFRLKLVQRRDSGLITYLQLADELAWGCYKPVLDEFPKARREPPLVFLNGGLSPFALSRDQAFPAEAVPGEPLGGRTYDQVLQRLPIPIIGVPWYQTAHLPDLPVVAHETGHAVEHDFQWQSEIKNRIDDSLKGTPSVDHTNAWKAWSSEVFADAWGCLALGPAYASALRDFLVQGHDSVAQEVATDTGQYPTATLRMLICAALLEKEFPAEAAACKSDWIAMYGDGEVAMPGYGGDVPLIAGAVRLPGAGPLAVAFTQADWTAAADAGREIKEHHKIPESATSAARLVAAARRLYDDDPDLVADEQTRGLLASQARELIRPGWRAGEAKRSPEELRELTEREIKSGTAAFEDFKRWVGVSG